MTLEPKLRKSLTGAFIGKAAALILITPFASRLPLNGTMRLIDSHIWNLAGLIFLIAGMVKIAGRKEQGWLFLGYYLYATAFEHAGVMVWIYILLAGLSTWTWARWKTPLNNDNDGMEK